MVVNEICRLCFNKEFKSVEMDKEKLDKLISEEILKSSGFINVDEKDVRNLIQRSAFIDGTKSMGSPSELRRMIENAVTQIESNHNQTSKRALLVIKQSTGSELNMDDMMSVSEVFSERRDDFDFVWGLSTDSNQSSGNISVIILLGF